MKIKKVMKYFVLWPLIVLLAVGFILRLALMPVAENEVNKWFQQQGLESSIANTMLDISAAKFSFTGLEATANGSRVLLIGLVEIEWSWSSLMRNQIDLVSIAIDGVEFNIETETDGNLVIAGLDLAKLSVATETDSQAMESAEYDPLQWSIRLHRFELSNSNICYRALPTLDYCNLIESLDWDGLASFDLARLDETDLPLEIDGSLNLTGVKLDNNQLEKTFYRFDRLTLEIRQVANSTDKNDPVVDTIISLSGLKGEANGTQLLALDSFAIETSLSALLRNKVSLAAVAIDGLSFDIASNANGSLVIAGIDLAELSGTGDTAAVPADAPETGPLQWAIQLQQLEISNFNFCYRAAPVLDYCSQFEQLIWKGPVNLDLAKTEEAVFPLRVEGNFDLTGVKLQNNQLQRSLLAFESLAVKGVRVETLYRISTRSILLEQLALLERAADATPPQVTRLEKLQIDNFELRELNNFRIKEINLLNHELLLTTGADKKTELNEWFPEDPEKYNAGNNETSTNQAATPIEFAIEKLSYQTAKSIRYQDNSSYQSLPIDLNNIEFVLQNLDSSNPDQDSEIRFSGRYGKNGSISLEGKAKPLLEKVSFDLVAKIDAVDLRTLSSIARDAIGHTVKTGQLDAELILKAKDNILDGDIDLSLQHFELKAESAEEKEKINARFGFPLNTSLKLIEDKNGTISLSNSISGDLDNPNFDLKLIIIQAITTGISEAVLSFYTGFGLISLDDGKLSLGASLNFKPVGFEPGNDEMTPEGAADLEKIAELMGDRPAVHVTLCAFTNTTDRIQVLPDTSKITAQDIKLDDDQLAKLDELSELREAATRNYLAEKEIPPDRMVQCQPEHVEGEGLSGVDISI